MLDRDQLTYSGNTVNKTAKEIAKFDQLAEDWRDPNGKFKHIFKFNQARLSAIEQTISTHFRRDLSSKTALKGLNLLDIGCGAGLLCEPFAQQGADVTGIDGSDQNIRIAKRHAKNKDISINYIHCLADALTNNPNVKQYDIVLNTEVIEHVSDQKALMDTCCQLLKPGGLLVFATLNRTIKSYLVAILGAEYVMRYLPVGTHEWRYFVKPKEISDHIEKHGLHIIKKEGMSFNPLNKQWKITNNTEVNYLLYAYKAG
ncbi:bifunctional 2-polyprenyl-6-hydroxyphenol methylase/3-demethylubiquinol 3-O-methyltransferase UbiG [Shewanella sp. UCD-KL12]|uniref:bifunctional 2-polyprenyl-6-hydroxyphenol methylase/3-demethylubiquinol 3-O-methyltransferase UbiG n=1 Tax=Shewanella sp. UCD-KL12 TaxID=1917163 RepID=UPI0009714394|nr:bifunctional 2-polyprenyl-6-hydroxyphenol methylase/3-demethylubiquinol 3-O-methyltransferase UbiG [Shewanella sp. UCD-KL12]